MKTLKPEIETVFQFAVWLLQLVGVFLTKPNIFNFFEQDETFAGGDPGVLIVFVVSILLLLLSVLFNSRHHTKYWIIAMTVSVIFFFGAFISYNNNLRQKTFLCTDLVLGSKRIIKGDNYTPQIVQACDMLKHGYPAVDECDIISNCIDFSKPADLQLIWPKDEIIDNKEKLMLIYYFCLITASSTLISGIQILKCKRNA